MLLYVVGFLAQVFFSARILLQWILSERAKRVVSPSIFWILSLAGSYLLFIYGWMRDDFAIVLGQVISYYIYIWNLSAKGVEANVSDTDTTEEEKENARRLHVLKMLEK